MLSSKHRIPLVIPSGSEVTVLFPEQWNLSACTEWIKERGRDWGKASYFVRRVRGARGFHLSHGARFTRE